MSIRSVLSFAMRRRPGGALARAGLAAALSIGISSAAVAQDSFVEDFESYFPPFEWLSDPWTVIEGGEFWVIPDENDMFGQGTDNMILEYWKDAEPGTAMAFYASNDLGLEVGRLSFDMVQPDDGKTGVLWGILHVGGRVSGSGNRAALFDIGDGKISNTLSYERGAPAHVEVYFNNQEGDGVIRYNGDYMLAAGTVDFWVDGVRVEAGANRHANMRGPIKVIEFNSASSRIHTFFFDNIALESIDYDVPSGTVTAPAPNVILHDNFADYTENQIPGGNWAGVTAGNDTIGSILVQKDAADLFGKGAENQYLEYLQKGAGTVVKGRLDLLDSEHDLVTFSLRMIVPTPIDAEDYSWFLLYSGDVVHTNNRVQLFTVDHRNNPAGISDINDVTFSQNVPVQIDLVINNKLLPVEYEHNGTVHTIESGKADIWANGVLGKSNHQSNNNRLGSVNMFEFNSGSTRTGHILVDEITVYDSVYVSPAAPPAEGGFTDWRADNFPGEEENDEISGPNANPSGDGVPNLLKYALGLSPSIASRDGLPTTQTVNIEGVEHLAISFTRPTDRDDVSYSVVATSDLSGWNEQAVLLDSTNNGDGTVTEVWHDPEPITSSSARFLRLDVSID